MIICFSYRLAAALSGIHPVNKNAPAVNNTGTCISFQGRSYQTNLRKREEIYEALRVTDLEDITKMTGCKKPCSYLKYQFLRQEPSILQSEHYAFSLWAVSNKTTIRTEQLIYPLTSLVAEFGGTLGLFLGISFITLWDNMTYLKQMCKVVFKIY